MCLAARNRQKIHNSPLFWHSRSSKVIEFGGNRESMCDFLLVINSNIGPILHRYWDTATYWLKIANFTYPLSFSALVWGDLLRIYEKALLCLKLESSRQPTVKIWWSWCFWLIHPVTDGRTDRQTDRQTELWWLRSTKASKNHLVRFLLVRRAH